MAEEIFVQFLSPMIFTNKTIKCIYGPFLCIEWQVQSVVSDIL